MKKFYESPSAEVEMFAICNILTTSTDEGVEGNGETGQLAYYQDGYEF